MDFLDETVSARLKIGDKREIRDAASVVRPHTGMRNCEGGGRRDGAAGHSAKRPVPQHGTEAWPCLFSPVSQAEVAVRIVITTICLVFACGFAAAQDGSKTDANTTTGRSAPEEKGQLQPQGWTGPVDTKSGGAPPESPQGQSPPGMQAAPDGSTKTVVEPAPE
ncbi:hypothetical protein QA641_17935 [Bradyrhizobium sp. CB1650]|uniref:hypothetical protein n=1 Tax=Bradyrhizobium sp. CB1650 TaxID=3039153 RepID=UPI002435FE55|nr:hypothetical protein [Bradyrhizobium sp. CB1650]WGD56921.1 hypothetical protein QA641_17935 [Bradyrhizobium sp. CB1650]